ncbi:MAG: hypothetical protein IJR70_02175 [Eubacterium sp.]|nr:hypothetical protein [Eubacterium sp.]
MKFGWINFFGALIIALILIPNIIYAIKNKEEKNLCKNTFMNAIEQIGRYSCIILMVFPLLVWEFGFSTVTEMIIYIAGNALLLFAYWFVFMLYFKKRTFKRALTLAIIPICIFLMSGLLLRHWLLVGFAVLFGAGHIYVTVENIKHLSKTN